VPIYGCDGVGGNLMKYSRTGSRLSSSMTP